MPFAFLNNIFTFLHFLPNYAKNGRNNRLKIAGGNLCLKN